MRTRPNIWRKLERCTRAGHRHSRDHRFCYWSLGVGSAWYVQDRIKKRVVLCRSRRQARLWVKVTRVFDRLSVEEVRVKRPQPKLQPGEAINRWGDVVFLRADGKCRDCGHLPKDCSPDDHK